MAEDKKILLLKEREWIEKLKPINTVRPIVLNKEEEKQFRKNYRENNKEKVQEQKKESYERNKNGILERRKEKYDTDSETILRQNKESYERNKHKYSDRGKEKIICEICNVEITRSSKSNHIKSKRHCEYIK